MLVLGRVYLWYQQKPGLTAQSRGCCVFFWQAWFQKKISLPNLFNEVLRKFGDMMNLSIHSINPKTLNSVWAVLRMFCGYSCHHCLQNVLHCKYPWPPTSNNETSNLQQWNLQPPTMNLQPPTMKLPTSNSEPPTSNNEPPTSNNETSNLQQWNLQPPTMKLPTSNNETSNLQQWTSNLQQWTSNLQQWNFPRFHNSWPLQCNHEASRDSKIPDIYIFFVKRVMTNRHPLHSLFLGRISHVVFLLKHIKTHLSPEMKRYIDSNICMWGMINLHLKHHHGDGLVVFAMFLRKVCIASNQRNFCCGFWIFLQVDLACEEQRMVGTGRVSWNAEQA